MSISSIQAMIRALVPTSWPLASRVTCPPSLYEAFFSIPGVQQTALPAPEPASSCCPSPWGEQLDQEGFLGQVPLSCCLPAHPIMGWTEYLISHYLHEPALLLLEHPEASDSLIRTSCWSNSPVSPSKAVNAETQAWLGGTRPPCELRCRTPSPDWRSMRCPSPGTGRSSPLFPGMHQGVKPSASRWVCFSCSLTCSVLLEADPAVEKPGLVQKHKQASPLKPV